MRRVVVTGLGIVCAAGEDKNEFYQNLIDGKPCVERVENFDVSLFNSKIASQDLSFDPLKFGIKDHQRMDRYVQFSIAAAKQAIEDSKIDRNSMDRYRAGVVLANAICGTRWMEEEFLLVTDWGKIRLIPRKCGPTFMTLRCLILLQLRFQLFGISKGLTVPFPPVVLPELIR